MQKINRRTFLEFLGFLSTASLLEHCPPTIKHANWMPAVLRPIPPSEVDELALADGLSYEVLIKWGDPISKEDKFGFNNDYTAFLPFNSDNPDDGLLWVNHEYVDPRFVSNFHEFEISKKSKKQVEKEMYNVGGSFVRIKKVEGKWEMVKNDPNNRRITGLTDIPFNWDEPIMGAKSGMGTLANCSGGVTPWGTILTCEENYDMFYGERNHQTGGRDLSISDMGWYLY